MRAKRVALVGFMGCGKTSVGKVLAERLAVPFVDLDEEIQRRLGRPISAIFGEEGEAAFRVAESDALAAIARRRGGIVLSCGGGIVVSAENRQTLAREFFTVWVDAPLPELLRRLTDARARSTRPLLSSPDYARSVAALLDERRPLYEAASRAVYRWREGDSTADSADAILSLMEDAQA